MTPLSLFWTHLLSRVALFWLVMAALPFCLPSIAHHLTLFLWVGYPLLIGLFALDGAACLLLIAWSGRPDEARSDSSSTHPRADAPGGFCDDEHSLPR